MPELIDCIIALGNFILALTILSNTIFITNALMFGSLLYYWFKFLPDQALWADYRILLGNKFLFSSNGPPFRNEVNGINEAWMEVTQSINRMLAHKNQAISGAAETLNIELHHRPGNIISNATLYKNLLKSMASELGQRAKNDDYSTSYFPGALSSTEPKFKIKDNVIYSLDRKLYIITEICKDSNNLFIGRYNITDKTNQTHENDIPERHLM